MDVDNSDIDVIACKFRTMNTNDKDHLISEFKRLSNTQLGTEGCCFYLDLAEWNLNSALWAYYEYETAAAANNNNNISNNSNAVVASSQTNQLYNESNNLRQVVTEVPEMQFVCDITIGEGESVAPNTNFIKTWRIKNTGTSRWPSGCTLKYVNGYNFSSSASSSSSSPSSTSSTSSSEILTAVYAHPVEIELPELEPHETADISTSLRSPGQCGIYQCQYRTYTRYGQPFGDPIWLLLNVEEGGVLGITQQLNSVNVFGAAAAAAHFANPHVVDPSELKQPHHLYHHQQQHFNDNIDSNNNSANNASNQDKRPDFYDDMFR